MNASNYVKAQKGICLLRRRQESDIRVLKYIGYEMIMMKDEDETNYHDYVIER